MMTESACYCEVCEQDVPLTRTVVLPGDLGHYSKPFKICEDCFETKPDEVIEIKEE